VDAGVLGLDGGQPLAAEGGAAMADAGAPTADAGALDTDASLPPTSGTPIFTEDWESGNMSRWDDAYSIYEVASAGGINGRSLRLGHIVGTHTSGSVEKGFADNAVGGYGDLSGPRTNAATVEANVRFSTNAFPSDGSTKILILESWPGTSYPSTADKDFQAIVEVASDGRLVVTIKREGWDFYTRYTDVYVAANRTYHFRMQVELDQPYTAVNGVLKFWVDGELLIDNSNEDFILSARGSDLPRGLNMLMIAGYDGGSGSPDTKSQWWDDIILSTP